MTLGKRKDDRQQDLFLTHDRLPRAPGHVFYRKLNHLLAEAGFDRWVETLCDPYYACEGRPSLPPGVYFRMLLVGYFEGIGSQPASRARSTAASDRTGAAARRSRLGLSAPSLQPSSPISGTKATAISSSCS